jgi:hypothetical protein
MATAGVTTGGAGAAATAVPPQQPRNHFQNAWLSVGARQQALATSVASPNRRMVIFNLSRAGSRWIIKVVAS